MNEAMTIHVNHSEIESFCKRHHITRFAFFGSVLSERFGPESDLDVLVNFDPEHIPTLFDLVHMEDELAGLFGRKIDLRTPEELSDLFRDAVVSSAHVEYAA